jgi:hypothetical protein
MALIANLRHYLGDDLSLVKIPAPAATLRGVLGCLVEAVTSRDPDDENYVTPLKCRHSFDGCSGDVIAFFDTGDSSIIRWSCAFCEDEGQITGWEGTVWDKSSDQ